MSKSKAQAVEAFDGEDLEEVVEDPNAIGNDMRAG